MAKKAKDSEVRSLITYDGSANDHADHPATFVVDAETGQYVRGPNKKRVVATPWRRDVLPVETYSLWGKKFPKGVAVEVVGRDIAKKAKNLGCFEVKELGAAAPVVEPIGPTANTPLKEMTKAELLELAEKDGLDVPHGATKAEILEIVSARAA